MQLDEDGNFATRQLPDGREVSVFPLTYGRARIGIGNRYIRGFIDAAY